MSLKEALIKKTAKLVGEKAIMSMDIDKAIQKLENLEKKLDKKSKESNKGVKNARK